MEARERGYKQVLFAVKSRYPEIPLKKAELVTRLVLKEIAKRISAGETLAFLKQDKKELGELITYAMKTLDD